MHGIKLSFRRRKYECKTGYVCRADCETWSYFSTANDCCMKSLLSKAEAQSFQRLDRFFLTAKPGYLHSFSLPQLQDNGTLCSNLLSFCNICISKSLVYALVSGDFIASEVAAKGCVLLNRDGFA